MSRKNTKKHPSHLKNLPIILASTSPYRKELLEKLGLSFTAATPTFDEDNFKLTHNLSPLQLAQKLAFEKSKSLSNGKNCVIGGDQLVQFNGDILGKPKSIEKAIKQLKSLQGKTHQLITAVHVIYKNQSFPILNITEMKMRKLSDEQIKNYLNLDHPLDCAGSYKIEKSGLTLFENIQSEDFSAIQGLPLMALTKILQELNYQIPGTKTSLHPANTKPKKTAITKNSEILKSLWDKATQARLNAHAPYSHFLVGAAVEFSDGQIFGGCNVENASYGGTVCAERIAIFNGISQGAKPPIRQIMVVTNQNPPWPPCGFCRQVMAEFSKTNTKVWISHSDTFNLKLMASYDFEKLLPDGFYPEALTPTSKK